MEEFSQRRLVFSISDHARCSLMATHITHIDNYARNTPFPFVKSLYHAHKYTKNDIVFAYCIYTDPNDMPVWVDWWAPYKYK